MPIKVTRMTPVCPGRLVQHRSVQPSGKERRRRDQARQRLVSGGSLPTKQTVREATAGGVARNGALPDGLS